MNHSDLATVMIAAQAHSSLLKSQAARDREATRYELAELLEKEAADIERAVKSIKRTGGGR